MVSYRRLVVSDIALMVCKLFVALMDLRDIPTAVMDVCKKSENRRCRLLAGGKNVEGSTDR